jgi:hypothetical protein
MVAKAGIAAESLPLNINHKHAWKRYILPNDSIMIDHCNNNVIYRKTRDVTTRILKMMRTKTRNLKMETDQ